MIHCSNFYKSDGVIHTYRFQKLSSAVSKGTKDLSKSTINIPADTGPNGEHIAIPSVCKQTTSLNVKCTFFVHNRRISLISFLVIDFEIS